MKVSNKTKIKVLEITNTVYEQYKDKLYKTVFVHQDLKDIITLGLEDPEKKVNLSEEERAKLQNYLDSGVLNETEEVPDWEVAKEYDQAIDKALEKAIEDGILPKYTTTLLKKKTRKYVKRLKTNNK